MFSVKSNANYEKRYNTRKIFKNFPEIEKQLWSGELWSDGGYIGTLGDGTASDVIKNYVGNRGNQEEKKHIKDENTLFLTIPS